MEIWPTIYKNEYSKSSQEIKPEPELNINDAYESNSGIGQSLKLIIKGEPSLSSSKQMGGTIEEDPIESQKYENQYQDYYYENRVYTTSPDHNEWECQDAAQLPYDGSEINCKSYDSETFISIDDLDVIPNNDQTIICGRLCNAQEEEPQFTDINDGVEDPPMIEVKVEIKEDDTDDDVILVEDIEDINEQKEVGCVDKFCELKNDQRRSGSSHECELCGKQVASSYNLKRHMMIHTGERPFGCDLCERRFREFSDLKKHRRVHAKERNFKCMVCHRNSPSETNPTKCEMCDQQEYQRSQSPEEEEIGEKVVLEGSNKRGYICPICDRIFGSRHNLRRHYMIHTGEKPFKCKICARSFREVGTLKKHAIIHDRDKEKRWCLLCSSSFSGLIEYNNHLQLHENEVFPSTATISSSNSDDCYDDSRQPCGGGSKFDGASGYEKSQPQGQCPTFVCDLCGKIFRAERMLNCHRVTHGSEALGHMTANEDVDDCIEILSD